MKNLLVVSMMVLGLSAVAFAEEGAMGDKPADAKEMKHKGKHKKMKKDKAAAEAAPEAAPAK